MRTQDRQYREGGIGGNARPISVVPRKICFKHNNNKNRFLRKNVKPATSLLERILFLLLQ